VSTGRVALVQRLGTYGLTVVLEHGNGYFSLYMQLGSASVQRDATVQKGETIGTVGGENTDQGAICTSRFAGRTRSRSIRPTGCVGGRVLGR
jgi:septal ring factor EnvC (AmiA/AmiB activator)